MSESQAKEAQAKAQEQAKKARQVCQAMRDDRVSRYAFVTLSPGSL
jgi:hypothetical protein